MGLADLNIFIFYLVAGLRISVLVTIALMFFGTGLRCITTDPKQATWWGWPPCPKTLCNVGLLKLGCIGIQIAWKTKTLSIPTSNETAIPYGVIFFSLILRILDFLSFAGINFFAKMVGFQKLLLGIIFCRFHVPFLKVTKQKQYITLLVTSFIEIQHAK